MDIFPSSRLQSSGFISKLDQRCIKDIIESNLISKKNNKKFTLYHLFCDICFCIDYVHPLFPTFIDIFMRNFKIFG